MAENDNNLDETLDTTRQKSGGSKVGNYAKDKAKEQAKKQAKKVAEKAAKQSAKMGAKAAGNSGLLAFFATPVGWVVLIIIAIIVIIITIIGIMSFFTNMPGISSSKLTEFQTSILQSVERYFTGESDSKDNITKEHQIELAQYMKDMGYDLIGDGFISDVKYYTETDKENNTIPEGKSVGDVKDVESGEHVKNNLIAYLYADQRIYTMKFSGDKTFKEDAKQFFLNLTPLTSLYTMAGNLLEAMDVIDFKTYKNFGDGMLNIDDNVENEFIETGNIYIDGGNKKLTTKVWNPEGLDFLNIDKYEYDIDGWIGRYGTPMELLLTMHLATMAPDLVYDWVMNNNLTTVVNITLEKVKYTVNIIYRYNRTNESGEIETIDLDNETFAAIVEKFRQAMNYVTESLQIHYVNGKELAENRNGKDAAYSDSEFIYSTEDIAAISKMFTQNSIIIFSPESNQRGYYEIPDECQIGNNIYVKGGVKDLEISSTDNGGTQLTIDWQEGEKNNLYLLLSLNDRAALVRNDEFIDNNGINRYIFDLELSDVQYNFNFLEGYIQQAKYNGGTGFKIDNYGGSYYNYLKSQEIIDMFDSLPSLEGLSGIQRSVEAGKRQNALTEISEKISNASSALNADIIKAIDVNTDYLTNTVEKNEYGLTWEDCVGIATIGLEEREIHTYQPRIKTVEKHWFKDLDFTKLYEDIQAGTEIEYEYKSGNNITLSEGNTGKLIVKQKLISGGKTAKEQPYVIKGDVEIGRASCRERV